MIKSLIKKQNIIFIEIDKEIIKPVSNIIFIETDKDDIKVKPKILTEDLGFNSCPNILYSFIFK